MCLYRQGHEAEARNLAIAAFTKIRPLPAPDENPLVNATADDLILWMAYKEAKALLKL